MDEYLDQLDEYVDQLEEYAIQLDEYLNPLYDAMDQMEEGMHVALYGVYKRVLPEASVEILPYHSEPTTRGAGIRTSFVFLNLFVLAFNVHHIIHRTP
ncbi:hypothetical protein FPOAC2_12921 [Fusarium poae]|jgi:hypothetical protein|uniref:Uncharacterized protein n=1 Tax=Fusarium poae TaxID=36050 RepID=A0A1B8AI50_FUSPO|nr:hypothetical protein FPOAC1_012570 [Fusarium poae]KAG8667733.1 hypothetical protein FPOAC1_012570 [Fusarium poae]OBS19954.1 hypothetical protein FPOA_11678 [Fusarium poae]